MQMIPIHEPLLDDADALIVQDCVRSGWVSSAGKSVEAFESAFASQCSVDHAVAVSNGTAALHLALHALGVGPGDEVIIPSMTFIATANAVSYTGATVIFADIQKDTWTLCPSHASSLITPRTKAIIPVHLYGQPARMSEITLLAEKHGLLVIEDAAEAHFAKIGDRCVGNFGSAACFSFYGNKIITTGEGGMVTTNNAQLAKRLRHLRNYAHSADRRYWHDEIGFNYRMSGIQAALGCSQIKKVDLILERKSNMAQWYREELQDIPWLVLPAALDDYSRVHWLFTVLIDGDQGPSRDALMKFLIGQGIDCRPAFIPLHTLPPYWCSAPLPVTERVGCQGLSLPSGPTLSEDTIRTICSSVKKGGHLKHG